MKIRASLGIAAATLSAAAMGVATAPAASAACSLTDTSSCNTTQTATVAGVIGAGGLDGVRTLATVPASTLIPGTGSSMTGPLAVTALEVAAKGDNSWSVTTTSSALTDVANDSISASHLSVADSAVPTTGGCLALSACTATGGGSSNRALNTAQTLFTVHGESAASAYTGLYAYTGNLTLDVPNGTPLGTYSGNLTITLVQ